VSDEAWLRRANQRRQRRAKIVAVLMLFVLVATLVGGALAAR
jgi:hypothetical protein